MSESRFNCGRCKESTLVGWNALSGHYCGICRRFICRHCWDLTAHACLNCADEAGDRSGTVAARLKLQELQRVSRQILRLSESADSGAVDAKSGLLAIKFADLSADVVKALTDVPPEESRAADRIRAALDREARRTAGRIAGAPSQPTPEEQAPVVPTPESVADDLAPPNRSRTAAMLVGAFVVVLAAVFMTRPEAASLSSADAPPTVEGQVAGGTRSPAPPSAAAPAGNPTPVITDFDSIITRRAPPGWTITGDGAQVVPFPNSVDRSLRIAAEGGATSACTHVIITQGWRMSADVHAAGAAEVRVWVMAGGTTMLHIREDGAVRTEPGQSAAPAQVATEQWYALSFELTVPDVEITLRRAGADPVEQMTLAATGGMQPRASGHLCFEVRADSAGELHVDNLAIYG